MAALEAPRAVLRAASHLPPRGDPAARIHRGMRHGVNLDPVEGDVRHGLQFCSPALGQCCAAHREESWRPEANSHERRDDPQLRHRVFLGRVPRMSATLIATFFLPTFMNGKTFVAYQLSYGLAPDATARHSTTARTAGNATACRRADLGQLAQRVWTPRTGIRRRPRRLRAAITMSARASRCLVGFPEVERQLLAAWHNTQQRQVGQARPGSHPWPCSARTGIADRLQAPTITAILAPAEPRPASSSICCLTAA